VAGEQSAAELRLRFDALERKFGSQLHGLTSQTERLATEAKAGAEAMKINQAKLVALQCLQRLLSRSDAADIFKKFDMDGDGTISRMELQLGLRQIGENLTDLEIDAIMAIADKDGDGEVDYTELVKVVDMRHQMDDMQQAVQDENMAMESRLAENAESRLQLMVQESQKVLTEDQLQLVQQRVIAAVGGIGAAVRDEIGNLKTSMSAMVQQEQLDKIQRWAKKSIDDIEHSIAIGAKKDALDEVGNQVLGISTRLSSVVDKMVDEDHFADEQAKLQRQIKVVADSMVEEDTLNEKIGEIQTRLKKSSDELRSSISSLAKKDIVNGLGDQLLDLEGRLSKFESGSSKVSPWSRV
jgi:calmodulin